MSKSARKNRNKRRRRLRKKGLPEDEVMRRVPIPGTAYSERLGRELEKKRATECLSEDAFQP